ncbi:Mbov_0401 family ICE element transposase-like protein, partial [Mesomycoplasma conjunctivae]|uniref:Mbov_0401 family ICE element transposase-like protein n=1 Tax=Mesomycoplasma conjunctivae TaxID=45361 RepID=UPI0005A051B5
FFTELKNVRLKGAHLKRLFFILKDKLVSNIQIAKEEFNQRLKDNIIKLDNDFFQSTNFRSKGFYIIKLKLSTGMIKVKVRRYIDENNKTFRPFNKFIDKGKKGQTITSELKDEVIKMVIAKISYKEIAKQLGISMGSITNIVNEANFVSYDLEDPQGYSTYIEADDAYVYFSGKNRGKYRLRMAVVHSGKREGKIQDKTLILGITNKTGQNNNQVDAKHIEEIRNTLKLYKSTNTFLISDGAPSLINIAKELNINHYLDTYHLLSKLNQEIRPKSKWLKEYKKMFNSNFKQDIRKLIIKGEVDEACSLIMKVIKEQDIYLISFEEVKGLIRIKNFFKKHFESIKNINNDSYIGSRTENFVANYVKFPISKKRALYSLKSYISLLKDRAQKMMISLKLILDVC